MKMIFLFAISCLAAILIFLPSAKPIKTCYHFGSNYSTRSDAEAARTTWKQENATKVIITSTDETEIYAGGSPPFIPTYWNYRITYTADKCLLGD